MGLFRRLSDAIRANINELIDRAEDPERLLDQVLLEMEESLRKAKVEVARAIADEKRLEHQYQSHQARADEWERKAMLAVEKGADDLAREALRRKRGFQETAESFKAQWIDQSRATDELRKGLKQLEIKVAEARRKKAVLVARAKRAEAQRNIHRVLEGMNQFEGVGVLGRLEAKVGEIEAHTAALDELDGDDLDQRFKALETVDELDLELAALKERVQARKLPPPSDGSEGREVAAPGEVSPPESDDEDPSEDQPR